MKSYQIFPPLSKGEYLRLKEDIKRNGVRIPVSYSEDNDLIDGYHREKICEELQLECPKEIIKDLDSEDKKIACAISLNLARRQLTNEQIDQLQDYLENKKDLKKETAIQLRLTGMTQEKVATLLGVSQQTITIWEKDNISFTKISKANIPDMRVSIPKNEHKVIYYRLQDGETQEQIASDYHVHQSRISQIKRIIDAKEKHYPEETPEYPQKEYKTIVIDPPWPIQKIEREERPNQGDNLPYSTMHIDEIKGLPIPDLALEEGCHLYLWVTQKYLPDGFDLLKAWGFKYQCIMTWIKSTGITPFSWMYNTEHILFAKRGILSLEKLGVKLSFEAKVEGHSVKPETFYDIVRSVSPEPRLDMFNRRKIDGFDRWGKEV